MEGNDSNTPVNQTSPDLVSVKKTANATSPIVKFSINNPLPAMKAWFKKIFGNEAITIKIPVLTAIAIIAFGLGGAGGIVAGIKSQIGSKIPIINSIFPTTKPSPTAAPTNDWQDRAITGTLKVTPNTNKYYLVVSSSSTAVSLQFNDSVDLTKYIERRILASGSYNSKTHVLIISDILDLEVLPQSPVPVITPEASAIPTASPSPIEVPTPTPGV